MILKVRTHSVGNPKGWHDCTLTRCSHQVSPLFVVWRVTFICMGSALHRPHFEPLLTCFANLGTKHPATCRTKLQQRITSPVLSHHLLQLLIWIITMANCPLLVHWYSPHKHGYTQNIPGKPYYFKRFQKKKNNNQAFLPHLMPRKSRVLNSCSATNRPNF